MFNIGDVVFARLDGYPEWPAQVIQPNAEHYSDIGMNKIPPNQRLVLFYNDDGQYAVMHVSDLWSIDDPRLQKKTRGYKVVSSLHRRLRAAFKSALEDHLPSNTNDTRPSPPSTPPNHRKRPKKTASSQPSQPTSPVTGHSDLRQSRSSQRPHAPTKPRTKSPSSPRPSSKPISPTTSSIPPTITSRTHHHVSLSTPPSRSPRSSTLPIPVKLRLRRKRSATASEPPSQSPHSHLSSPSHVQPLPLPSPKRRRTTTNTEPNYTNQSQTEHSNGKYHNPPKHDKPPPLANLPDEPDKHRTDTGASKKTDNPHANPNMSVTGTRSIIPRSSLEQSGHRPEHDNRKALRDPQKPVRTDHPAPRTGSKNHPDKTQRVARNNRASREKTVQLDQSDDDLIANDSSNSEQDRRNNDARSSRTGGKSRLASNRDKMQDTDVKREADYVQRPSKRRKTNESRESGSEALEKLSKKESVEVITRMMYTIRSLHVEKWQDGYKRAGTGGIIKTEKEISARCKAGMQKAKELLRMMKSEERDKLEVSAKEREAFQAVMDLREVYFDVKTMNLQKVGSKMMSLGREIKPLSPQVWSAIRDVLIMWADLTSEGVNEEVQKGDERKDAKKEKSNSDRKRHEVKKEDENKNVGNGGEIGDKGRKVSAKTEKAVVGNDKRELSARQERLMKFDRNALMGAFETTLGKVQEELELDARERRRFTRKLEEAIRPRFEDDRSGYYEASVKVMKGLKRATKNVKEHGTRNTKERSDGCTTMFLNAVRDETGEKAELLVKQLLR